MAEAGRPASSPASKISPENLSSIKIPEEIGKIQEVYQGKSQDLIILVQDAHAVPDAQRNIQNIISHFQKEYGLDRVALEGASRELDPQIFRSFPDKKLLKQTFEDYFKNGELAGTVAAAIFSSQENGSRIVFQGVEDWSLYEDGIALYLSALQEENSALEKIYSFKEEIEKQKELIYSKQLLELDRTLADFESNHARLFDVLKKLARIQLPEKGTELALLIGEIKKDGKSDFSIESEIKKLVKDARASLGSTQADMGEFNHKFQDFRTSRITPEAFALYLKERVDSLLLSNRLNHLIQNQKRLKEIEGTKFFQDFEQYTQSVKNSLFQNEEERKLDQVSREILILKRLARLELSHQDWNEIKNHSWILDRGLENDLKFHLDFYQNAQKRDKALFHHLMESTHTSLLVAGGFHTQGLTEQLKEKGISYLLLTPAIKDIPEANHYRQHMSGDVSWKNYFKVENGKVDLHGAFVRALRDRLLSSPRQEGFDAVLAKQWRDQIIRDLAASGRIEKAGDYTPFLDEIFSSAASTDLRTLWQARVENFLENLNLLQSQNQLTESNVLKLLNPATSVGLTTGPGGALQRGTAVRPRLIPGAFPARFNPRAQNKKVKPKTAVDKKSRPVEKITKMHVTRPKGRLTGRLPRLGARSELRSVDWRIVAAGVLGVGIIGFIGFIRLATEESRLRRQYTEWIHKNTFTTLSYNLNSQNLDKIVRGLSKTFYNRDSRNTGVISWISVIPIWPFHNLNRVFASRQLNFGWPWLFGSYRDHSQIAPVARTTLLSFVKAIENNPSFERIKLLDRDFSGDAIAVDYVRETLKELASGTNSIISRAAQEVLEGKHFAPKSKSEMRISPAELTHEVSPQGITPLGYYGLMVMAGLSAYWFFKTANGLKDIFIGVLAFIVSGIAAHLGSLKADRVRADRPFAKVRNELETILKQAKQENYSAAAAINNKIAHYPLIDRLNIWIFAAHELSQVSDWLLAGDDFKVDYKADRGAFSVTLHRVSASSKSELRLPARQREKKLRQETARFTEYHRLTSDQLKQLRASIQKFMEKVPGEETMLRNYQGLPDFEKWVGKEFLKVNIGGTNLEIARQRLKENGKLETLAIKKYRFSVADKSGTSKKLFNLIAAKIGQVVKNDKAYPVELIWSFPAKLNSLRRGKILTWNKGWNVPDAIGQNPVTLLESALKRKGLDKVRVRALQNDTTWALIQGYLQNPDTFVGFVASTGFNIAYFEKKSVTNPNARSDGYEAVNTEIGAALDGVAESLTTTIDRKVDTASTNPKVHILEKLIAAKYLAEQLRIQIRDWMNDGIIFNGQKIPPVFNRRDALKPELLSLILADKTAGLKRIKAFLETKGIQSTPAERQAIQKITKVVSRRSATILAYTLAEVAQKASPEQVAQAFAGDSSLRDSMPGYAQILSYAFGTATQDDSFPYQFFSTRLQSPAQKPAAAALSELRTVQINVAGNGLAVKGEHLSRTFTFELGDSSHTLIPPGQIETKIKDVFKDRKPVDWGVPDEKSGMAFYLILDDESLVTVFSDGKVLTMNDFDRQVRSQWRQQDWHSGLLAATKTPPPLSGLGLAYYSALTAEIKRQAPDNADARQIIARHVVQHVKTLPEIEKIAGQSLLLIMLLAGWVAKSPNLLLDGKNRPLLPPALQSAEDAFEYAIKWYETVLRKGGQDSLDVTLPSLERLIENVEQSIGPQNQSVLASIKNTVVSSKLKDLQQALRTIVRDGEEEEPGDILISPTAVSSARQLIARIDQIEILALGAAKDGAAKSELRMDETLFKDLVKTANEWFSKNPVARGRHYKVAEPGPDDPGVEAYQIVWLERTLALAPSLVASKLVGTEFFKTQLTIYIPQSVSTPQNFFDIVIAMLETEAAKTVFYGRPESYARWDNSEKQGLVSALNETILGRSQPIPLRSELRASELMVNMVIKAVLQPVRKDPQAEPEIPAITRTGLIDLLSQIIEGHPVSDAVTVNRINHVLRKVRLHPGDRRILGEIKESLVHLYDDKRWQGFVGAARSEARVDGDFNDLGWVVEQTNTYRDRLSETSQETLPGFLKELLDFQNDLFRHWKSKDRPQQVEEILGRLSDYWTAATERLQSRQEPLVKEVHEQEENNLFAPLNDDALALRAINTHFGMSLVTPLQQLTEIKRHLEKFNELLQSAFPRHSREFQAAYIKALQTIAGAASRPTVSYRQLIDSRTTVGDYIDAADKVTSRNRVPTEKLGRQLQHWGGLLSTDYNQTLHQLLPDINLLHSPRSEVEPHIIIGLVDEQQRLYSTTAQSGTFRDESEPEHVLQFPTLYETLTKIPPTWRILLLPQRISQEHVSPKDVRVLRRAALQIENLTVGVRDALTKQTFDEWKKGTPEYDQELLRIREDQLDRGYPAATSLALQMARQVLHDLNWQPTPGQRWLFIEPNSAGLPHFFALHQQDVTVVSSNRDVQELFDSREITGWLQAEGSPVKLLRGSLRQDNIAAVLGQEKKFDYVVIYASDRGNLKELIFRTQDWKQPTNGGWYAGIIGGESPEEVEQTRREVEQVFQVPGQNAAKSVKMEKAIAPGASFADRFGLIILNRSELRDAVGLDVSLAKGLNITKNRRGRLRKIQKALGAKIRLAKTDKGRHQLMNEKKDGLQAWLLPHINLDHRLTAKTDLWDSSPAALKKHKVLNKIIRLARKARNQGVTDWVHVGVGGSIASAQALVSPVIGTNHNDLSDVQRKGRPRAHWVGDNYDPVKLRDVLRGLEGRGTLFTTIFHDVSKSGTTGEPFTAYMFIRNWLETRLHEIRTLYDQGKIRDGKFGLEKLGLTKKDITPISSYHNGRPRYPTGRFFIVSTGLPLTDNFEVDDKLLARLDAGKASKAEIDGLQSEFLKQHYTETDTRNIDPFFGVLPVPEGMGGRFSTFSAVGLMTAAAVVPALGHEREYVHTTIRAASEAMKKYLVDFKADDPRNTPFLTALAFYLWGSPTGSRPARGSLQLMDFAPQTFDVASLMQELWNESVVENNQGPHLQMNLGTNQNHMNLQGIFGNPKGHIGWFFRTAVAPEDDFQLTPGVAISRSLKGFEEQKQGDIQMDSAVGTAKEFSKFDIPVISWDLQGRTAYDIAHLIATLQLTVAVFGDLRNLGAQTYLQQHVVGYKEQTRKEMAKRETKPFNEAGVPTGPTESINILLNAAALSEMRSSTSSKEEEFLENASAGILAAFHDSNSAEALNNLFPVLIQRAKAIGNPGLISRALRRAFDSFGKDDKKQREFTGALGMAMTKNSAELGDDFQSQAFPPRVLQGRGTVWTIATSPTIDIDAQKKLLEWEDPKSLLMGPGGGGINVAIALARLGLRARPLFFYAGKTGEQLIRLIKNQGVYVGDAVEVDVDDQTRVTMVINPHDKTENLVPKGIPVTPLAQQQLIGKLLDEETGVQKGDIVVISGSLAPGLSDRFYADLGQKLRVRGAVVIIDTKGPAAKEVLFPTTSDGPAAATIVSMNQFEFGELVGVGPQDIPKLTRKAREIIESRPPDQAIQEIIITLGPKGAFSVTRDRVWEAPAPQVENVESEVGAGDWSLAQRVFEAWSETEPVNGFIRGVAAGTASVQHPGTGGGTPAEVDHFTKKIPVTEHVLVEKPYPRGEVPTAELVQANRLTAAVTSSLAAAAFAKGLIGYYHRLIAEGVPSNLALQFAQIELDAIGQDIFTEVHDLLGIDVRFHGYEGRKKKGMGALKAGPRLGILGAKEEVWGVVDVFDGSELIVRGEADPGGSGGSSIYLIGPLVKAFGPMPDQLGAGLVIFGVPHKDQMKSFYDKPLDPDAPVTETLHRAASANEVTFNELDVYLMDRSRLEAEYRKPLKDLQKAYPGLRIIEVHHGSHDEALRAVLGQENGRVPVFLGTAGSTEAVADYLIALLFDTVAVGLRIYGDYSKTIGDAAGTLARTLAELDKDQLAKARKVVPELDRLPHNIPIRYLFSRGIQTELRKLNRRDTKAILSPTGRFFHNQSIKFPRTSTDTPSIALFDDQGGAIALVPGIKHDDPILSAATSFVLPSRILEMPAVRERFPGHIEVPTLHIERVDGKTYDWVDYRNVSRQDLANLLPDQFPPPAVSSSEMRHVASLQPQVIRGNRPSRLFVTQLAGVLRPRGNRIQTRNIAPRKQRQLATRLIRITPDNIAQFAEMLRSYVSTAPLGLADVQDVDAESIRATYEAESGHIIDLIVAALQKSPDTKVDLALEVLKGDDITSASEAISHFSAWLQRLLLTGDGTDQAGSIKNKTGAGVTTTRNLDRYVPDTAVQGILPLIQLNDRGYQGRNESVLAIGSNSQGINAANALHHYAQKYGNFVETGIAIASALSGESRTQIIQRLTNRKFDGLDNRVVNLLKAVLLDQFSADSGQQVFSFSTNGVVVNVMALAAYLSYQSELRFKASA